MDNFLTRLELQGFKSFCRKDRFGISLAGDGYRGAERIGEINVIDAVRWVLGEREAKQLRDETLDNLIFAGTPKKPAMGLARVGLYFNNHKKFAGGCDGSGAFPADRSFRKFGIFPE